MQKSITLAPGESKQVAFTVTPQTVGVHGVNIDGLSGIFTVHTPPAAKFIVTDLVISPSELYPGETVSIGVTVTNIGEVAGSYTVTCEVM